MSIALRHIEVTTLIMKMYVITGGKVNLDQLYMKLILEIKMK